MLHDCPITCYDFLLQSSSAFLHGFHCPNAVPDVINKMALHGCSEFSSNLAKMGCPMYDPGPVPDTRPTQWVGYHTRYRGGGTVHWTHSWVREQLSRFSIVQVEFRYTLQGADFHKYLKEVGRSAVSLISGRIQELFFGPDKIEMGSKQVGRYLLPIQNLSNFLLYSSPGAAH